MRRSTSEPSLRLAVIFVRVIALASQSRIAAIIAVACGRRALARLHARFAANGRSRALSSARIGRRFRPTVAASTPSPLREGGLRVDARDGDEQPGDCAFAGRCQTNGRGPRAATCLSTSINLSREGSPLVQCGQVRARLVLGQRRAKRWSIRMRLNYCCSRPQQPALASRLGALREILTGRRVIALD